MKRSTLVLFAVALVAVGAGAWLLGARSARPRPTVVRRARPLPLSDAPELRVRQARRLPDLRDEARADRGRRSGHGLERSRSGHPHAVARAPPGARHPQRGDPPRPAHAGDADRGPRRGRRAAAPPHPHQVRRLRGAPVRRLHGEARAARTSRCSRSTAPSSWRRSRSTCSPTRRSSRWPRAGSPRWPRGRSTCSRRRASGCCCGTCAARTSRRSRSAGKVSRTIDLHSDVAGYVVQKMAFHGMRVTPADTLFDIADLSQVWVLADVYESDLPLVRIGMQGELTVAYLPGRKLARPGHLRQPDRRGEDAHGQGPDRASTTTTGSSSPTCSPTSTCARTSERACPSRRAP